MAAGAGSGGSARAQQAAAPPHAHRSHLRGPGFPGKTSSERAGLELARGVLAGEATGCGGRAGKRMLSQKPDFSTHSISSPSVPCAPSPRTRCRDVARALITSVESASDLTDERAYPSAWQPTFVLKSGVEPAGRGFCRGPRTPKGRSAMPFLSLTCQGALLGLASYTGSSSVTLSKPLLPPGLGFLLFRSRGVGGRCLSRSQQPHGLATPSLAFIPWELVRNVGSQAQTGLAESEPVF